MLTPFQRALLRRTEAVYRTMLHAYPSEFRMRYGADMVLVFRTHARRTLLDHGTSGLLAMLLRVGTDWLLTVLRERCAMNADLRLRLNRVSTVGLLVISAAALLVVLPLWYGMLSGHVPAPDAAEGTAAHLFQLCIALLLPLALAFVASVDWSHPAVALKPVTLSGVFLVLALGTVFYLENVYYAAHGFPPPRPGLPAVLLRHLFARFR